MAIKDRIKKLREENNITQEELASVLNTTKQTVYKYENGLITNIPSDKIELLANCFRVSPAYLMGWDETTEDPHKKATAIRIPVIGMVHAGVPTDAIEEVIDWEEITPEIANKGEIMALQVKGDCMEPKFSDGDVVIVLQQPEVNSGDVAIIMVNSDEAIMRKVKIFEDGGLNLIPTNPTYQVKRFSQEEIEALPVRILGKVIELRAKF